MISLAMFGPVSAADGRPGRTSLITSVMRRYVSRSNPFVRLTTGIHGRTNSRARSRTSRKPSEGTPTTRTSAVDAALSRSEVASSRSGSGNPARYREFSCRWTISSTTSSLRAHSVVGFRFDAIEATVVPQDPAPSTVTFMDVTSPSGLGLEGYPPWGAPGLLTARTAPVRGEAIVDGSLDDAAAAGLHDADRWTRRAHGGRAGGATGGWPPCWRWRSSRCRPLPGEPSRAP